MNDEPNDGQSTTAIVVANPQSGSVAGVLERLATIQELMKKAMDKDVDYGAIPGTGDKPTLLKPGAEKLCVLFRLAPSFKTEKTFSEDGHLLVESTCQMVDASGVFLGDASAICTTRESKYAYRRAGRKCPSCGKEAILRSKFPPRHDPEEPPGWYCFTKKGGCGANYAHNEPSIISQTEGRVANEDIADSYHAVVRIAEKRAYVAAVREVTGSSSLFDEEIPGGEHGNERADSENTAPAKPATPSHKQPQDDKRVIDGWITRWHDWIELLKANNDAGNPVALDHFQETVKADFAVTPSAAQSASWKMIADYAKSRGWGYDGKDFFIREAGAA